MPEFKIIASKKGAASHRIMRFTELRDMEESILHSFLRSICPKFCPEEHIESLMQSIFDLTDKYGRELTGIIERDENFSKNKHEFFFPILIYSTVYLQLKYLNNSIFLYYQENMDLGNTSKKKMFYENFDLILSAYFLAQETANNSFHND